jgi:hypothetical protein
MDLTLFDRVPLWGVFLGTLLVVLLSVEVGLQVGRYRRRQSLTEKESPVGAIVGATLGLLAFMLAFTFGLAASRFDARRMVVLEEANAIGTTYLRAGLLTQPHREQIRQILRKYVEIRLAAARSGSIEKLNQVVSESTELQNALWSRTMEVSEKDPHSIVVGLFIQSLNEMIDLHAKRILIALHNRVPEIIWWTLYSVTFLSMGVLGYQEGLVGSRRSIAVLALALCFSWVMFLIADLDRPHEGAVRVSQQSMIDLQASFNESSVGNNSD